MSWEPWPGFSLTGIVVRTFTRKRSIREEHQALFRFESGTRVKLVECVPDRVLSMNVMFDGSRELYEKLGQHGFEDSGEGIDEFVMGRITGCQPGIAIDRL